MDRIHKFKNMINQLENSRGFLIVFSVVAAIVVWFTVIMLYYPTSPKTLYNIPVVVELENTSAAQSGLSVVSCDVTEVTVQLIGNRSEVGILTAEDLTAYVIVQNVNTKGEYSLELTVDSDSDVKFTIDKIEPSHAKVEFDKIETRSFEVTPAYPNLKIAEGHTLGTVSCEPKTIDITGPSTQLDQIETVKVTANKAGVIDSSHTLYATDVTLYTKEESILDTEALTMPTVDFKIDIPILTQKTLDLTYSFNNMPAGFDEAWLRERLQLSTNTITLASTDPALAKQEELHIGFINLNSVDLDFTSTFDLTIQEGYINQSGIKQVTVSLDAEGLSTRQFTISGDKIPVVNAPSGYDFNIITENLTLTLIGPEEVLNELTPEDITVSVDLMGFSEIEQNPSFSYPATISVNECSQVWPSGSSSVVLERLEQKTDAEE